MALVSAKLAVRWCVTAVLVLLSVLVWPPLTSTERRALEERGADAKRYDNDLHNLRDVRHVQRLVLPVCGQDRSSDGHVRQQGVRVLCRRIPVGPGVCVVVVFLAVSLAVMSGMLFFLFAATIVHAAHHTPIHLMLYIIS